MTKYEHTDQHLQNVHEHEHHVMDQSCPNAVIIVYPCDKYGKIFGLSGLQALTYRLTTK